jgi:hypothetical protein
MNTDFIIAAIDADIQQLQSARAVLIQASNDSPIPKSVLSPTTRPKRSKAARARMAETQRKGWMAKKAEKDLPEMLAKKASDTAKNPTKPRLSVEARKRIADAQRKRWAAIRAQKASPARRATKKASTKKAVPTKKTTSAKKAMVKKAPDLKGKKFVAATPQAVQS